MCLYCFILECTIHYVCKLYACEVHQPQTVSWNYLITRNEYHSLKDVLETVTEFYCVHRKKYMPDEVFIDTYLAAVLVVETDWVVADLGWVVVEVE